MARAVALPSCRRRVRSRAYVLPILTLVLWIGVECSTAAMSCEDNHRAARDALEQKAYGEAARLFTSLLEECPDGTVPCDSHLDLATLLSIPEECPQILSLVADDHLLCSEVRRGEALVYRARCLAKLGRGVEARTIFKRIDRDGSSVRDDPRLMFLLGTAYREARQAMKAEAVFLRLRDMTDDSGTFSTAASHQLKRLYGAPYSNMSLQRRLVKAVEFGLRWKWLRIDGASPHGRLVDVSLTNTVGNTIRVGAVTLAILILSLVRRPRRQWRRIVVAVLRSTGFVWLLWYGMWGLQLLVVSTAYRSSGLQSTAFLASLPIWMNGAIVLGALAAHGRRVVRWLRDSRLQNRIKLSAFFFVICAVCVIGINGPSLEWNGLPGWGFACAGLLLAAVAEEYVFRYLIFRSHAVAVGPTIAVLSSAFLFARAHEPEKFAVMLVVGASCAVLLRHTRQFMWPVFAHWGFNVLVLFLAIPVAKERIINLGALGGRISTENEIAGRCSRTTQADQMRWDSRG